MDSHLGYEVRLKVRCSREATAIVDRCLAILARAESADPTLLALLEQEVEDLQDELALRFGAPQTAVLQ